MIRTSIFLDLGTVPFSLSAKLGKQRPKLKLSHFATLRNDDIRSGLFAPGASIFDFADDVDAVDDFAEDDVLVVEKGGGDGGDEELAAVGVGSGVLVLVLFRW